MRRATRSGDASARYIVERAMTVDHLSARTRRRLARSPFAPLEEPVLRTPVLAQLLLHRLVTLGPMPEGAAILLLESRAPGRANETIEWAKSRGMLTRIAATDDEPAMIGATHTARHPVAA
jgi:hypothetical protein